MSRRQPKRPLIGAACSCSGPVGLFRSVPGGRWAAVALRPGAEATEGRSEVFSLDVSGTGTSALVASSGPGRSWPSWEAPPAGTETVVPTGSGLTAPDGPELTVWSTTGPAAPWCHVETDTMPLEYAASG